jgi:hypothetical protein
MEETARLEAKKVRAGVATGSHISKEVGLVNCKHSPKEYNHLQ